MENTSELPDRPQKRKRRAGYVVIGLAAICLAAAWPIFRSAAALLKWHVRGALAAHDPDRALDWLDRNDRWFGADGDTCFLRARANRKKGDWSALVANLKRARELGCPRARIEREQWLGMAQSGQLRDAEPQLSRLLADPQDDGAEICEAFVNGYFLNHRLNEAARLLTAWIADFPKDPEPLYIRGKIRLESQFLSDAEQDFRRALAIDRAYWPAACELADTLVLERQFDGALEIYRRAATIPAHRVRAQIGETKCLRLLECRREARASVRRLLDDVPDAREGLLELGLLELDEGEYAAARVPLEAALALNPRALVVRQALSRALRGIGDVEGAQEHAAYIEAAQAALQRADQLSDRVARDPRNADLRCEIGMIYLKYAVPERGLNWLKSALDCAPGHRAARQALDDYFADHPTVGEVAPTRQQPL